MQIFKPSFFISALLLVAGWTSSNVDALNSDVRMYGINYNSRKGPDWAPDAQRCKNYNEVLNDMYTIKQVTDRVRIYSLVDCDQAKLVLPLAKQAGLQVSLGIWTTNQASYLQTEKSKLVELINAGLVDSNVIGLHVGSEAIYRKDITANTAISYMKEIRDYIRSRNINIPVTIADVIDSYYNNPQLIDAVDVISINQFSFWEAADVNEGVALMLDRLKNLRKTAAAKGKDILISETGWSSAGQDKAAGVASMENQAKFFKDFYLMAQTHNLKYYWFVAFDSQWRVQNGDHVIEANFGVYREDRGLKTNFQQLNVPKRTPVIVRNVGSKLFLSENAGDVYMSSKSNDWLVQEQQTWFFDSTTSQVRSKSSDRCLDAYEAWDGGRVHVYKCLDGEGNQKWNYDSATGRLMHAKHSGFCLDTDPAQNNKLQIYGCSPNNANQQWVVADPSSSDDTVTDGSVRFFTSESSKPFAQLVRQGEEVGLGFGAQNVDNSQWLYDAQTNLVRSKGTNYCLDAYEAKDGGHVHVWTCDAGNGNQKWNFDTTTNQLRHATHNGFCLDADLAANNGAGKIQLWWCLTSNNSNQVWRKVSSSTVGVVIRGASVADSYLEPNSAQDTVVGKKKSGNNLQNWFWDSSSKRFISKSNGQCLDAYEAKEGGRVHTYACIENEGNQKWNYDATKQQIQHAKHTGFCLALSDSTNKVAQLKSCRDGDATQLLRAETL